MEASVLEQPRIEDPGLWSLQLTRLISNYSQASMQLAYTFAFWDLRCESEERIDR